MASMKPLMACLEAIFNPQSVAVVGATERPGVGCTLMKNLMNEGFRCDLFPINLKRSEVFGLKCYKSVKDIPQPVNLAIIVIRAKFVPQAVLECAEAGVKSGIVISAGFKEMGEPGLILEEQIKMNSHGTFRIIGPNCLGVMSPRIGFNGTFASFMPKGGNLAFLSQSGAMCTAMLDWSSEVGIGFSAFVSVGSMLDLDWGDLIRYFGQDESTHAIVLYVEGLGHPETFYRAARATSVKKPIVMIKAGRTQAGARAAASHTGALTGADDVLDALCERAGVLRVESIQELFVMADFLSRQPLPRGRRLTIVTNAGGPGVLATDTLTEGGGKLTQLSKETFKGLDKLLPASWSRSNPVDILGDANAQLYADTLKIAAADPNADGLLVILTPQIGVTNPKKTAEYMGEYRSKTGKPVMASWMGGKEVLEGRKILRDSNIPVFHYPDLAARVWNNLNDYNHLLKQIAEADAAPLGKTIISTSAKRKALDVMRRAIQDQRELLTEHESKEILEAYEIPVCRSAIATTADEAVQYAKSLGFPVVIKVHSETITHKSDVGGVRLGLKTEEEVRTAFEDMKTRLSDPKPVPRGRAAFLGVSVQEMVALNGGVEVLVGMTRDPQYGPLLVFGAGGVLVEIFKDSALAVPPFNKIQAYQLIRKTRIFKRLQGFRGEPPVDLDALVTMLVRFSYLISDLLLLSELDINPLLLKPDGVVALDARMFLDLDKDMLVGSPIRRKHSTIRLKEQICDRLDQRDTDFSLLSRYSSVTASEIQGSLEELKEEQETEE